MGKDKKIYEFEPKEKPNPSDGLLSSKKDKQKRFENTKHTYYKKGNHLESSCMKKSID